MSATAQKHDRKKRERESEVKRREGKKQSEQQVRRRKREGADEVLMEEKVGR